jgi:hypothetical protein
LSSPPGQLFIDVIDEERQKIPLLHLPATVPKISANCGKELFEAKYRILGREDLRFPLEFGPGKQDIVRRPRNKIWRDLSQELRYLI